MSNRSLGTAIALAAALAAAPAQAVNWDHSFLLQGRGGILNPAVLVGFNPQPEPPDWLTELGLSEPPEPNLTLRNQSAGSFFDVFLAIDLAGMPLTLIPPPVNDAPTPTLHLQAMGADPAGAPITFFDVFLDFMTSSGGVMDGASAVSFNPQPEPPGFGAGSDFGLNFTFTSFSDVSVGLRVFDAQGNQISFAAVPEPAGLTLMGLGLAILAWRRSQR